MKQTSSSHTVAAAAVSSDPWNTSNSSSSAAAAAGGGGGSADPWGAPEQPKSKVTSSDPWAAIPSSSSNQPLATAPSDPWASSPAANGASRSQGQSPISNDPFASLDHQQPTNQLQPQQTMALTGSFEHLSVEGAGGPAKPQPPRPKTAQDFLGDNARLVNLDQLVLTQGGSYKTSNPFAGGSGSSSSGQQQPNPFSSQGGQGGKTPMGRMGQQPETSSSGYGSSGFPASSAGYGLLQPSSAVTSTTMTGGFGHPQQSATGFGQPAGFGQQPAAYGNVPYSSAPYSSVPYSMAPAGFSTAPTYGNAPGFGAQSAYQQAPNATTNPFLA